MTAVVNTYQGTIRKAAADTEKDSEGEILAWVLATQKGYHRPLRA